MGRERGLLMVRRLREPRCGVPGRGAQAADKVLNRTRGTGNRTPRAELTSPSSSRQCRTDSPGRRAGTAAITSRGRCVSVRFSERDQPTYRVVVFELAELGLELRGTRRSRVPATGESFLAPITPGAAFLTAGASGNASAGVDAARTGVGPATCRATWRRAALRLNHKVCTL